MGAQRGWHLAPGTRHFRGCFEGRGSGVSLSVRWSRDSGMSRADGARRRAGCLTDEGRVLDGREQDRPRGEPASRVQRAHSQRRVRETDGARTYIQASRPRTNTPGPGEDVAQTHALLTELRA